MEIICVCGSVRFKDEMLKFRDEQNAKGNWILLPENMEIDIQKIDIRVKEMMDSLHKAKIDHADSILVWNRNGYIGKSTLSEIAYALSVSKPVKYLEKKESLDEVWFHSVKIEDLHYGVVCSVCGSLVIDLKSHGKWHVEGGH